MSLELLGKYLLIGGGVLILVGLLLWGLGKAGFKGLPGDIHIEKGNMTFSFPVVTCIVLSIILTLVLNFFNRK